MKQTPKSCSCSACRRGKGTKTQKFFMKKEERGFRHQTKVDLKKGKEDIAVATYGSYTD